MKPIPDNCCLCNQPVVGWKRDVRQVDIPGDEWAHWAYVGPTRYLCKDHINYPHYEIERLARMDKELKPGRELDRLVAEAMGWWLDDTSDEYGYRPIGVGEVSRDAEVIPYYSTHTGEAIPALEWLKKNNPWGCPIEFERLAGIPTVIIYLDRNYPEIKKIEGETYAHAIAKAVVEAKKEQSQNPT